MASPSDLADQLGIRNAPYPPSVEGLQTRANRPRVIDLSGSNNGTVVARINIGGQQHELRVSPDEVQAYINNPRMVNEVLNRKFYEYRQVAAQTTANMSPLQKAALATMAVPGVGDAVGLMADAEMFIRDPDSRTWTNALLSAAGAAGLGAMAPPPSVARQAMGVGKAKRRVETTGKYVGAPSHVDSPQALGAMRSQYMQRIEGGMAGRDWYTDSSRWVNQAAPEGMRQQVADALGVTSQGTSVDSNLGFTVKGINQGATGTPVNTGRFPNQANPLIEGILAGENPALGPKRQPFAQNLGVEWNPLMARHPVHDIWQGRAFGYTHANKQPWDAGFSPQQHAFMDEEMAHIVDRANQDALGGFTDWDPLNAQAAAWTGAKINAGDLRPQDAAKHFGSFSPKYEAAATYEQIPGAGSGHLQDLLSGDLSLRQQYTDDPMSSWLTQGGNDRLYDSARMLQGRTDTMVGAYTPTGGTLEINPGRVARPLVQTSEGALLPSDKQLLDVIESSRAYVDAQNAGAWHRVIPDSQTAVGQRDSLMLHMDRSPDVDEMRTISELAEKHGFFAVDTGRGVNLINSSQNRNGTTLGKELKSGQLGKDLKEAGLMVGDRVKIETGYIDYQALLSSPNTGKATEKFLADVTSNPTIMSNIEPALKEKARLNMARDAEYAEKYGMEVREDIQRARQILFDEGLAGLKKALEKNPALLPAIGAGIVLPVLVQPQSDGSQTGRI